MKMSFDILFEHRNSCALNYMKNKNRKIINAWKLNEQFYSLKKIFHANDEQQLISFRCNQDQRNFYSINFYI